MANNPAMKDSRDDDMGDSPSPGRPLPLRYISRRQSPHYEGFQDSTMWCSGLTAFGCCVTSAKTKPNMTSDRRSLLSTLQEWGCCPRCQLRFQGLRWRAVYVDPKPEIIKPSENVEKDVVCPLCLGILQELCEGDSIHKLGDKLRQEEFEFSSYIFLLTLPLELLIRKHMFLLFLKEAKNIIIDKSEVVPIKDVFKWVCGPLMSADLGVPFRPKSPFSVHLTFNHPETETEVLDLVNKGDAPPKKKRRRFHKQKPQKDEPPNRAQVIGQLKDRPVEELKRLFGLPPTSPTHPCICRLEATHEPIFVAGRYNKFSRSLSQTPWILDGVRMTTSSVQEHICEPMKASFKATGYNFVSSGREDVDVKCLGKGRPFAVELSSPHKAVFTAEDMKALQKTINTLTTSIAVRDLQIVTREDTMKLKQGEEEKSKDYTALVWVAKEVTQDMLDGLNNIESLTIAQKTPIRVLQRRSLATRERLVHSISASCVDDHHFNLKLRTQAGTYIKEFVHGDLGRTRPNIASLLNTEADILSLDVEAVNLDWPASIDDG